MQMRRKKLNKNSYVLEIIPDSTYALYLKGELVAVSNSAGDITIDEEVDEGASETMEQFVKLLGNDNPLVFETPKELLMTSDSLSAPLFYHDWRA